jgi:hypothetical protein
MDDLYRMGVSGGGKDGTGGNPFDDGPGTGTISRIVSITIQSGSGIFAIQIQFRNQDGITVNGTQHGKGGGQNQQIFIPESDYIFAVSGRFGSEVNYLQIQTANRSSGNSGPTYQFGNREGNLGDYLYNALPGTEIVGFWGRAGDRLDAIGVLLRPMA